MHTYALIYIVRRPDGGEATIEQPLTTDITDWDTLNQIGEGFALHWRSSTELPVTFSHHEARS